jgi:ribose transport system ATP-binding protein
MKLRGIAKRFGATVALAGVDLDVAPGEVHALIGENGAGKSTLLNIVSGLVRPDAGTIEHVPVVAHIHQELSLCPHLTVAENILLGREPRRRGWLLRDALNARAATLLEELGRGAIDPRTRAGELPLADQQIVEICRALASDAHLILMDEPTSSLQRASVERLFTLIRKLRDRGIAIVYVSHFLEEVREIADRYTVLRDGRNVMTGKLREVTDPELIAGMVGRDDGAPHVGQTLLSVRTDSSDSPVRTDRSVCPTSDVALQVRDLAAPPALKSASFDLHRGEILGIAGLIGSGRTEMLRALFGLMPATGTVRVRGNEVKREPRHQIENGVGYLSEDRKGEGLALPLTLADNVTLSRFPARAGWIDLGVQASLTTALLERLRIKSAGPHARVASLSGGNQQKVVLARLLHQDVDILLLDEPARGIDIGSRSDIHREIARLASGGKAILVVSSYLPELFAICTSIAVMSRGRLGPARPTASWTPDTILEAAIGSEAA